MVLRKLFSDPPPGTCRYCHQKSGFLSWHHKQCRDLHTTGIQEMTQLAAQAAGTSGFSETALRSTLQDIATRARATPEDISLAIANSFAQGVNHAMQDGTLTQEEETNLRTFRDRMADQDLPSVITSSTTLDRAATDRITGMARRAALDHGGGAPQELENALRRTSMSNTHRRQLLIRAWEEAVEGAIEDGVVSLDEENALYGYLDHFGLTTQDVNLNGTHTSIVQAAVIRDITMGIIPQRQNVQGRIPFNLMKSETLVWVIDGVDYLETVVRRERRGTSHGVSIRVARGFYYRPSTFRSRPIEWEETVHQDTSLLGLTTKHIYFSGSRKKFRLRYDRIVSFDPYDDGFGIMSVKGGGKVDHCGGGIVYHRHDEKGLNWEPGGVRSGAGVRSSGVSQESSGSSETWEAAFRVGYLPSRGGQPPPR